MKNKNISAYVAEIINSVAKYGDRALMSMTLKYDGIKLTQNTILVDQKVISSSDKGIDTGLKKALDSAYKNVYNFHKAENSFIKRRWSTRSGGMLCGQFFTPIESVGLYVPGGRFSYPSTVIMSAVPARIAGVSNIVIATPARNITPALLYAAKLCGINSIYRIGGPAVIAALAIGTKTIAKVDFIAGPGNVFVNEAKRQLFGKVGIDSLAGPSEVVIVADEKSNVDFIVADISAQVEHDPQAKAYLITNSKKVIALVKKQLTNNIARQTEFIYAKDCDFAKLINNIAPEHLEIMTEKPTKILSQVKNAGAVFVGHYTPTAFGDYLAGPSHVLPTGASAKFSSGLSVLTFLKRSSFSNYSIKSAKKNAPLVAKIARAEGLVEHANSALLRGK